jgi:pSer/pThr/pTyr-binding forkhead associated (FHA) protein
MHKLVISDDKGHTTIVPLLRDEITIGREEGNTIRLTERNVSRSHARIVKRSGDYVIEDLGSYNGVILNGSRIDTKAELSAGDQLAIGDYDLAFQAEVAPTANTVPSPQPASEPPARLVVLGHPAAGAEFSLTKQALRIGRDERLDIWINHKSISHEHAEIQVKDGTVMVYDLESANGVRVNGVDVTRAVLEAGDVLELGQVRFRFLPPQGAHSLEPLPDPDPEPRSPQSSQKPLFIAVVLALLVLVGAGAVLVTMRTVTSEDRPGLSPVAAPVPSAVPEPAPRPQARPPAERRVEPTAVKNRAEQEDSLGAALAAPPVDEPQEWEGQLSRAGRAMARGRLDRAYSIANELPEDSVLRETPEFGEIRYRYAQAHIQEGELALEDGDVERAMSEAELVLGLDGITPKQRQDARRLMRKARQPTEPEPQKRKSLEKLAPESPPE